MNNFNYNSTEDARTHARDNLGELARVGLAILTLETARVAVH